MFDASNIFVKRYVHHIMPLGFKITLTPFRHQKHSKTEIIRYNLAKNIDKNIFSLKSTEK